jgi:hypothetical protein
VNFESTLNELVSSRKARNAAADHDDALLHGAGHSLGLIGFRVRGAQYYPLPWVVKSRSRREL